VPNPVPKLLFLDHTPGVLNEQQQNIGGFRGKRDSLVTSKKQTSCTVQTEPAEFIEALNHTNGHRP
jgi:hypothetical protein